MAGLLKGLLRGSGQHDSRRDGDQGGRHDGGHDSRRTWGVRRTAARIRRRGLGELLHIPPSLRGVDPIFVDEWADGQFSVDGVSVALDGGTPLEVRFAPDRWHAGLSGFRWLANVPMAPEDELSRWARAATRALVEAWLSDARGRHRCAADADVTARRLISFLAYADLVLEDAELAFFDRFIGQIEDDAFGLMERWQRLADADRIVALAAVAQAGLCFTDGAALAHDAEAALLAELARQTSADGGHISRDPHLTSALLRDLVPLKQIYGVADVAVPAALTTTIQRMSDFVIALRLGDETLTRLAMSAGDDAGRLPLRGSGVAREPLWIAGGSGFVRMSHGTSVVLIDGGSDDAQAGALAFELSAGVRPIVVSSGRDALAPGAAQSDFATLRIEADVPRASKGAGGGLRNGALLREAADLSMRHTLTAETIAGGALLFDGTHAGPSAFGFAHRRTLELRADGRRLSGHDTLRPLAGLPELQRTVVAFLFPLHAGIEVVAEAATSPHAGKRVRLQLGDGTEWQFEVVDGGRVSIEDGVSVRDGRRIGCWQLVVRGTWPECRGISWLFEAVEGRDPLAPDVEPVARTSLIDALSQMDAAAEAVGADADTKPEHS